MTPASQFLQVVAETVANSYKQLPTIRAAMVTGSVAKGLADTYSDIDMTLYYADELPDEADLHTIREGLGGSERVWVLGDRSQGSFAEAYELDNVQIQIGHTTIASWEATIAHVRDNLDVESSVQKAMEGTLACQAIYGKRLIDQWKATIADYPPALGKAMVEKNLQFFPVWGLEPHFQTRDATLWYHAILVESAQHLIGILAGLNQLYFTTFQFKRMQRFIDQMAHKPHQLGERIEALFTNNMHDAVTDLEALVQETIQLVERHLPEIDTTYAKRRIGWRIEPWIPTRA